MDDGGWPIRESPETPEERQALNRGKVVWSNAPDYRPGDLLPDR